ncbi:MAG: hypothetical protein JXN64_03520 [Spirochaetes bacterium]|nr:hypothetical protein [Spirochaetota bacterium]
MLKNIKIKKLDELKWPMRCPYCGQSMEEGDIVGFDLKIRKTFKVLLVAGLGQKRINVKLCGACGGKISKFKTMETAGSIIIFAAIILALVFKVDDAYKIYIGGTAFWLGIILMGIGEIAAKKLVGVECRLLGENKWEFKFRNDNYYKEFEKLNSKNIYRM